MLTADFNGRQVVVTGGSAGIGRAAALAFAGAGADVVVVGRDAETGGATVEELVDVGAAGRFVTADVATEEGRAHVLAEAGDADVLVNCAGFRAPLGPAIDLVEADYDRTFATNTKAPFFLSAAFGARMAARGSGVIVNVSSVNAQRSQPGFAAYNASKAALDGITRSFAEELGPAGVRVNGVAAGPTWTPYTERHFADVLEDFMATNPVPGAHRPEHVAAAIVFLASDAAAHVTGVSLPVDGGRLAVLGA